MAEFETLFPNLKPTEYQNTSPQTRAYNCIAWAVGDTERWWEPAPSGAGYYWPIPFETEPSVENAVEAFKSLGFTVALNSKYEEGYEKVAIYGQDGEYTHAARQLPSGKWTSKIGGLEDIQHDSLEGLVGTEYGIVDRIMKRQRD